MKTKNVIHLLILLLPILSSFQFAQAELVELDLLSLGCPTHFDRDVSPWSTNFDLGVQFYEIHHVYMDWSGDITGGLAISYFNPNDPFPKDVGIGANLGMNPKIRGFTNWGGEVAYPNPESFDLLSEVELIPPSTWNDFLDGKGSLIIGYEEYIIAHGSYIEGGSVNLDKLILTIDAEIIPEPATCLLLSFGILYKLWKIR